MCKLTSLSIVGFSLLNIPQVIVTLSNSNYIGAKITNLQYLEVLIGTNEIGGLKSYKCDTQKTQGAINPRKIQSFNMKISYLHCFCTSTLPSNIIILLKMLKSVILASFEISEHDFSYQSFDQNTKLTLSKATNLVNLKQRKRS